MSIHSNRLDPIPELKTQLSRLLVEQIEGFSAVRASVHSGLSRQQIGAIRAGRLDDLSLQRLVRALHRLGARAAIHVTPPDEARLEERREEHARIAALVATERERRRRLAEKRRAARSQRQPGRADMSTGSSSESRNCT